MTDDSPAMGPETVNIQLGSVLEIIQDRRQIRNPSGQRLSN